MTTLRFRSTTHELSASLVSQFRMISKLSIAEIRSRAAAGEPLLEITPFRNDWQERRNLLVQVARDINAGNLPLDVSLVSVDGTEERVTLQFLRNKIEHLRQIELET